VFDELKFKILGLLWCEGDAGEKAKELFDCMGTQMLSCRDHKFLKVFELLMYFASEVVFENEPRLFRREPSENLTD